MMLENNAEFVLGFVVNPYSGMGGAVGLKGTDGTDILEKALALGAKPRAGPRATSFLRAMSPIASRLKVVAAGGEMGGVYLQEEGMPPFSIDVRPVASLAEAQRSSASDTIEFVSSIAGEVDLLVFAGGDGTARDVLRALTGNDGKKTAIPSLPVLGIPAGVKIHSGVFAVTPKAAASLAMAFFSKEIGIAEAEVMDIDEELFRSGRVQARLYGYLQVPHAPALVQGTKVGAPTTIDERLNKEGIANHVVRKMARGTCYIIGPGSTTKPILDELSLEKTLLGIDAVLDGKLVGSDLNEEGLLALLSRMKEAGHGVKLVMTVIGSQGFLFGRGNLQLTPKVIRAIGIENIIIVMTRSKFNTLPGGTLRNDTGDPALDKEMRGLYRVLVDDGQFKITPLE